MKLAGLVTFMKGKKPSVIRSTAESGDLRLLQIEDLRPGAVPRYAPPLPRPVVAEPGDVVLAWDGANAGTSSFGLSGMVGSTLAIIRPNDPTQVATPYLGHFLRAQQKYLRDTCKGATVPHIDPGRLRDLDLPVPPLPEQLRVASILDHVEGLRARRRQVLTHTGELVQSIFVDIFGMGLSERERVPLKSMTSLITKGTTPTSVGLSFSTSGIPFLRVQNLAGGAVRFGGGSDLFIDESSHRTLKRSRIQSGDLLISIAGTIGRCAVVPPGAPEMNCNQAVAIIRLLEPAWGQWLMTWLSTSDALEQIRTSSVTATISNLSLGELGSLQVPQVHLSEATEFNRRVARAMSVMKSADSASCDLDLLYGSLQDRAFKGCL